MQVRGAAYLDYPYEFIMGVYLQFANAKLYIMFLLLHNETLNRCWKYTHTLAPKLSKLNTLYPIEKLYTKMCHYI